MGDRQVFIGNLCNISNETLQSYCESFGTLTEISFNREKENNIYHCFAFVTFQSSRCLGQFLSNRPHFINGEEIFVKRALPRSTSSIPERLIVTNRLILRDYHRHDKYLIKNYFQKFGQIKNFDIEQGFIDFTDYDDVDRILLSRPHFIRDKEILVTKYLPHDQQEHRRYSDLKQSPDSSRNSRLKRSTTFHEDDNDHRYENLQKQFEKYQQTKEIEISMLKTNLEETKRQLNELMENKLDLIIQNQQSLHNELINRLFPDENSNLSLINEDPVRLTPNKLAKKRKLTTISQRTLSIDQNYDYYS